MLDRSAAPAEFIAECRDALARAAGLVGDVPDINPVRMLAYRLSRLLESGELSNDLLARAAKTVCDAAFRRRAARLNRYAGATDLAAVLRQAAGGDVNRLATLLERPRAGVVFTAHPTFALSGTMRAALSALADDPHDEDAAGALEAGAHAPDPSITVESEHRDTQAAIARAQAALHEAHRVALTVLRELDPDRWKTITPRLATLASWVGYDFDGRADIHWSDTFRIRLVEKAAQLRRYEAAGRAILGGDLAGKGGEDAAAPLVAFISRCADSAQRTEELADHFLKVAGDPDATAVAANALTGDDPRRLVSAEPLLELLSDALAAVGEGEAAEAIWLLRADVAAFGLGTGEVHLRVNAQQVRNAARADFDIDPDSTGFGRVVLGRAAAFASSVKAQKVNFASVYVERATARRQLMLAAQIRKHVDADAPIRFLIAETESPVIILAAIALAKRYGVAEAVDISPLFETPHALEGGARLMEQLLAEPAYVDYARARGRVAIQIGFSDSGRYMGQLAAGFAAERLQMLLARALAETKNQGLEVVLFNTHGESMGRGAHPGGMRERLRYVLPPRAASQFVLQGIPLVHETSFQGGDGLGHYGSPSRALRSLSAIIAEALSPHATGEADRFYNDVSFSWDFYRSLKDWHEHLRDDPDHGAVLATLGRNLLFTTGSRPVKRVGGSAAATTRSLRAIPHNAILQQLGVPANVACGVGNAAEIDPDRFVDLAAGSERARTALTMAGVARGLTSLTVLRAYAGLFDPTFWSSRAYKGGETNVRAAAERVAGRLKTQRRTGAYARLANLFAADLAHLDALAERVPALKAACAARADERGDLELLHAMRLALLMRACLLAAQLPAFSDRYDVTRDELIDLVLDCEIEEATRLLDLIFPEGAEDEKLFTAIEEHGDVMRDAERGYAELHQRVIAPLRGLLRTVREIGVGVSHAYDAYG